MISGSTGGALMEESVDEGTLNKRNLIIGIVVAAIVVIMVIIIISLVVLDPGLFNGGSGG
ncbi:MAG: hypothetical protein ACTSU9_10035 [Promethearchaeota archaeon]